MLILPLILLFIPQQAHYRLIEALALEKLEVETEQDCTLPPVDRQRKKIGHLADEFWKAHSYKGENTSAIQQQKAKKAKNRNF